jgi:hypothetical protein
MEIILPRPLAENIHRLAGRIWLLPRLLEWWDQSDERFFMLTGGPGTGKSMILAWLAGFGPTPIDTTAQHQLVRLRSAVKAAHFCQASGRSISPRAFAEGIANQLTSTVPGFGDALVATLAERVSIVGTAQAGTAAPGSSLTGVSIGRIDLGSGEELSFDRNFTQPLTRLYANGYAQPILLLVDALDEAQMYTGVRLPHLLSRLHDLPALVRILASTRDDPDVLEFFQNVGRLDLIFDAPSNVDDVRIYAKERLPKISTLNEARWREFAVQLATRAQGNFRYATQVLEELLAHPPATLPDLDSGLPETLGAFYNDSLMRKLGMDHQLWLESYEPLLGLIAVAQGEGLTAKHLVEMLVGFGLGAGALIGGQSEWDVRSALRDCNEYLFGELSEGPFRLFHKSFADFLLEDTENVDYHIDAVAMHRRIAHYYLEKLA